MKKRPHIMRRRRHINKAPPLGLRVAGGDLCGIAAKATTEAGAEKAVFVLRAKIEGDGRFFSVGCGVCNLQIESGTWGVEFYLNRLEDWLESKTQHSERQTILYSFLLFLYSYVHCLLTGEESTKRSRQHPNRCCRVVCSLRRLSYTPYRK